MKYILSLVAFCLALILVSTPNETSDSGDRANKLSTKDKSSSKIEKVELADRDAFLVDHLEK